MCGTPSPPCGHLHSPKSYEKTPDLGVTQKAQEPGKLKLGARQCGRVGACQGSSCVARGRARHAPWSASAGAPEVPMLPGSSALGWGWSCCRVPGTRPPTHMLAGPFPWGPAGVGGSGPGLVFGSWVEWGNRSVLSAESAGRTPSQLLCGVDSVCGRVFVARMATAGSHPPAGHSGV